MPGYIAGLNARTDTGELTIDGVLMHTPAWNVLDCLPLWLYGPMRGDNVVIPGASGTRAYPLRAHEARHSLEMAITGFVDSTGAPYADPWVGLEENIDYLRFTLAKPPLAPDATVSASLVMPSGETRNAEIQVAGLQIVEHSNVATAAILDIVIPSGRFAVHARFVSGITVEVVDLAALDSSGASPQSSGSQTGPGSPGNVPPGIPPGGGGGIPPGGGGGGGGGSAPPGLGCWLWIGVVDLDRLVSGLGGFTFADLVGYGVEGIFVSANTDVRSWSPSPGWLISELQQANAAGLKVGFGPYCAVRGHPPNNATERADWLAGWEQVVIDGDAAGVDTYNCDMETYESDTAERWDGGGGPTDTAMFALGQDWADIMGARTVCLYPSSEFSWVDSNNDELAVQNGNCPITCYADNRAAALISGFFDSGGSMTLLDASFHFMKQNTIPATMADAIDRLVMLTEAEFPDATAAAMFWPDNNEREPGPPGSHFSPAEIGYCLSSSNGHATGPTVLYEHELTTGDYYSYWSQVLAQIAGNI